MGRRAGASTRGHLEKIPAGAVHLVVEPENALAVLRGLKQHGAAGVAEENAGGAIFVVRDRTHHVRPDHERTIRGAAGDELGAAASAKLKPLQAADRSKPRRGWRRSGPGPGRPSPGSSCPESRWRPRSGQSRLRRSRAAGGCPRRRGRPGRSSPCLFPRCAARGSRCVPRSTDPRYPPSARNRRSKGPSPVDRLPPT